MVLRKQAFCHLVSASAALVFVSAILGPTSAAAQALQICAQPQVGLVVAIPAASDCGDLPGQWVSLSIGDNDWEGAGTGALHTANSGDRVGIGVSAPAARLHVQSDESDPDAFVVQRSGSRVRDLTVTDDGQLVVGAVSGINSRLTVNGAPDEPVFRARAGGSTSLFVGADGQVGIRTSQPQAALQVNGSAGEDILRLRRQGVVQPEVSVDAQGDVGIGMAPGSDKLLVHNDGSGRTGFFQSDNPNNNSAALGATTNGGGNAIFARILDPDSTNATINAIHNGGGRAGRFAGDVTVSRDLGIGSSIINPATSLHVEGDNDGTDVLVRDSQFARTRHVADSEGTDVILTIQARSTQNIERAEIGTVSSHSVVLFANGQRRIVLETDGSVCIGNC